jgi:hypothetical protein
LWTQKRWLLLMLGNIAMTLTLVFDDIPQDFGRIVFYAAILFTEQQLRAPSYGVTY